MKRYLWLNLKGMWPKKPGHVCLLKKSFYGLKKSPIHWYLRFDEFIITHEYVRCNYNCCVYFKLLKDELYMYPILHVDDMLIACKMRDEIEELKQMLNSKFNMNNLGPSKKILSVEIKRNKSKGEIFLTQEIYFARFLNTYKMLDLKPIQTPFTTHFQLSNSYVQKLIKKISIFQMYIMLMLLDAFKIQTKQPKRRSKLSV